MCLGAILVAVTARAADAYAEAKSLTVAMISAVCCECGSWPMRPMILGCLALPLAGPRSIRTRWCS